MNSWNLNVSNNEDDAETVMTASATTSTARMIDFILCEFIFCIRVVRNNNFYTWQ
jgi:hypothetical protein